jgi:L-alanine-DL-glutamate epimerase-like enolase superfamily enzyme
VKIADVRPVAFWDGRRNWLVIVVETDNGLIGLGEAGIGAHQPAITGAIETFRTWLVGQDATRIEYIWQYLFRGAFFPVVAEGASRGV